ncbi:LiaF transmembrane domain-containing protein [Fulvivirga sediminis]|uniref:Cell wall-active antibiotics response LiaF-like C-terminal domain-containing protein n=1 Tax=Fulvivirga sediminis TaxID=2803949 RepID=A0A937K1X4_9BACT|nr:DUF5668 domain-containing protein [Fulvivirga sediminis]MBL3657790.1 hypothetical protein [Fulvivirga sediminis]
MSEHSNNDRRVWLGVFLVIMGGTLLLHNLDLIPYFIPHVFISVKSLFILLGIYLIVGRKKPEVGVVFIALGGVLLARDLGWLHHFNIWQIFWPAVIVLIGISLITRRGFRENNNRQGVSFTDDEKKKGIDYIDDFAVFGGHEINIDSQNFKGGRINAVFGGSTIDLRNANLYPGVNVLDLFAMFGGTSIVVPPDWTVHVEVSAVLGGFSDKRVSALKVVPDPQKILVIKGFVMFGGGDVKLTR